MRYTYTLENNTITIETGRTYAERPIQDLLDDLCISRPNRYTLLQEKRLLVNDVIAKQASCTIPLNAKVTVILPEEDIDWVQAEEPCHVIYENDFVMIVHKEPGIIIHGDTDDTSCLNAKVAKYLAMHDMHFPVRPIHRLDQDTTGLVLYSKIPFFQPWFDKQLEDKNITRHYMAIASGKKINVGTKFTCIDPIGRDRHNAGRYRISKTGKNARTNCECLAVKDGFCLIGCALETGRTHQIRVHLSARGLPIVNDPLYGHPSHKFQYMGLWADSLTFRDPLTRKKHKIHDDLDPDYSFFTTIFSEEERHEQLALREVL